MGLGRPECRSVGVERGGAPPAGRREAKITGEQWLSVAVADLDDGISGIAVTWNGVLRNTAQRLLSGRLYRAPSGEFLVRSRTLGPVRRGGAFSPARVRAVDYLLW